MEWLPMCEKLEKADFALRVKRLIGDMREVWEDRIAFVRELWSVAGETVPEKTAGSREWQLRGGTFSQAFMAFAMAFAMEDMNIYKMKLEQFQVNTKFLNSLPPEWSKFVTDVKLVKDLHTTNFDQLHAYLEQHELHANEVRLMRERSQDPLALVAYHQMTPSYFNTY
ncbi:hypothetical protein Tco_0566868 [Tanacetum coccineum]